MANTSSPRNVIYYSSSANPITLAEIASLPYTDVILGFLIPDPTVTKLIADGGAFTDTVQSDIQTLQAAGKNVLISVGGEVNNDDPTWTGWTSAKYATCAENVRRLAAQIVYWVENLGVNGVDIDFEDSGAFAEDGSGGFVAGYNGIQFLSDLTSKLYQNLPPGSVITHAPQIPYWDVNYNSAPYRQINEQAGQYIIWYNTQFYNNSAYDSNDARKVSWYLTAAEGIPSTKLLMGVSIDPSHDEGAIGPDDIDDMTQNVIMPLQAQVDLGGVMTWQFANDNGGAWGIGISTALGI
jgi:chitinase